MENSSGYSTGKHGGSIRQSGGAFGAKEFLNEEIYFRQEDEKKFQEIKKKMESEKEKDKTDEKK